MLLIGSRAGHCWHPEITVRETSDIDIICEHEEAELFTDSKLDVNKPTWVWENYEFHNANFFLNRELHKYNSDRGSFHNFFGHTERVDLISSRGLAVVKRSHLHRSLFFTKHMIHYQSLDKDFNIEDHEFIKARKELILKYYPDRIGSKNVKNEDYFTNSVSRDFNHDDLHKIVAFGETPIYLDLKKDKTLAAYDPDLWFNCLYEKKLNAVREECFVIALERILIPKRLNGIKYSYRIAFDKALEKACTTLDDGLFREFAIDNWAEIRKVDLTTFDRFFNSILWQK